jgi:hypothetical protein
MLPKDAVQFMTVVQGTLGYLDPEYLQDEGPKMATRGGVNESRFQFSFECGRCPKINPKAPNNDTGAHSSQLVTK